MTTSPLLLAADRLDGNHTGTQDPAGWVTRTLNEHLWSKQVEILESVRDHAETIVHSCHGAGKSFIAARAVAWWLNSHPPGSAFAVTSAPTFSQVRAILWREIGRAHRKGKLRGRVNQTELWIGQELVAFGRKPSDYDEEAFQGIHAEYVLVVLDEASGIPAWLWEAAGNLTTTDGSRILAIGNPNDAQSEFASRCEPGQPDWRNVIRISAFDTPNFTDEPVPDTVARELVSQGWVAKRTDEWGEDDPRYQAKVLGLFPDDDEHGVVPYSQVQACQQDLLPPATPVVLGVDVGAGGDETVIRERRGPKAGRVWRFRSTDSEVTTGRITQAITETGATRVNVDVIGIGWGVVGRLRALRSDRTPRT